MRKQIITSVGILCIWSFLFFTSVDSSGSSSPDESNRQQSLNDQAVFVRHAAKIWGEANVWEPSPTVWVQYESDLAERTAVDYEHGTVELQLLVGLEEDPLGEEVLAHFRQGIRNLLLGDAEDPVEMVILNEQKKKKEPYTSHNLTLGYKRPATIAQPLILDQIRSQNGTPVLAAEVEAFTAEVVTLKNIKSKKIVGKDGKTRRAVTVEFNLVPDHLEIRARKYYPMVKASALKYGLDPSIIMGIIHTESMFNPRARSRTPAFGLMQLVPRSGAREAYTELYGKPETPSAKYLYAPRNNIELGVTYFGILRNRYMSQIVDPESRTYCTVAAYNAGASNVGMAFIPDRSIKKATPVINSLQPDEVYKRLVEDLHLKETRLYTQKVLTRSVLYSAWN